MYEEVQQLVHTTLNYVSDKSSSNLEKACLTTQYYGRRTKESVRRILKKVGYDEKKAEEYYTKLRDEIKRQKAAYVYPYINPETIAATVDAFARKIMLSNLTSLELDNSGNVADSAKLLKSLTSPAIYPRLQGKWKRRRNPEDIEIVFKYRLDIMKLLEMVALEKIKREEEDRVKRWNKRFNECNVRSGKISLYRKLYDAVPALVSLKSQQSGNRQRNDVTTDERNVSSNDGFHARGPPSCTNCDLNRQNERTRDCINYQHNLRPRKKTKGSTKASLRKTLKRSTPQSKNKYYEVVQEFVSKYLEDTDNENNSYGETESVENSDRQQQRRQSNESIGVSDGQRQRRQSSESIDDKRMDSGSLVIQVPENIHKIVLEKDGKKISIEI